MAQTTQSFFNSSNLIVIELCTCFVSSSHVYFLCIFWQGRRDSWHGRVQSGGSNHHEIWSYYKYIGSSFDQRTPFLVVNQIFNWFVMTSLLSYCHLSDSRSFLHSVIYFLQDIGNRMKSMSDFFRPTAKNENEDVI